MNLKKIFLLLVLAAGFSAATAQQFTVASYNIRYANAGDKAHGNGWEQRCPVVCGLIRFHDFDLLGAQEVLHGQLQDMLQGLDGYGYTGVGRDDGKTQGEYAPIFYKKEKFALLQSGNFWLSPVTDKPNKGWDAALPRICTWAEMQEKESGFRFWIFNLHMDHIGVEARRESAKLVLVKIRELTAGQPVVLTGDFNVDQNDESYRFINTSGVLRDSYETTQFRYALNGTFNNFKPDLKTDSRIDHIFVSDAFEVLRYGVLTDTYRSETPDGGKEIRSTNFPKEVSLQEYSVRLPSDHFPIKIELKVRD
jgi:endonuclease/exonuclease/phosphatase family metal-dependent hydrolase